MEIQNTFLSLAGRHVGINCWQSQRRLLTHLNTFVPLTCTHAEIGRYGQERLLIVLVNSQSFLISSLQLKDIVEFVGSVPQPAYRLLLVDIVKKAF